MFPYMIVSVLIVQLVLGFFALIGDSGTSQIDQGE